MDARGRLQSTKEAQESPSTTLASGVPYNMVVPICAGNPLLFVIDLKVPTSRFVSFDFVVIHCFRWPATWLNRL